LWIGALNCHPAGLAELKGQWPSQVEREKKKKESESRRRKSLVEINPQPRIYEVIGGKALRLDVLQAYNYNLSEVMGTVLSEHFSFQRLDDIRDAYFRAFEGEHEIWKIMLDTDIRSVCAIRNMLIHKAGLVDADFKTQVDGIPRFAQAEIEKPLPIDGSMVRDIVGPFLDNSLKLIQLVDEWIKNH